MFQGPDSFLLDARERADHQPVQITVRDLLSLWGWKRRGWWIVGQVEGQLARYGLRADPPIAEAGWIGSPVWLVPASPAGTQTAETVPAAGPAPTSAVDDEPIPAEVGLQVGMLEAANRPVVSVTPQDGLDTAQSLMMRHDYSQLAVMSGRRDLRGAVSWDTIAQARIRDPRSSLADAVHPATTVHRTDDLLALVPRIIDTGFVFVLGKDRSVGGIVTTADLSYQFDALARPFFVLGEIERRLRRVVAGHFTSAELREVVGYDGAARAGRTAGAPELGADDLTMGHYVRLLESPERWAKLGWSPDRKVFVEALDDARKVRNEVMHFSPDPLDPEDVQNLVRFLKRLRQLT